jgi:hypothetical protein
MKSKPRLGERALPCPRSLWAACPASSALRDSLDTHARLQRDIAVLRAQAAKEKQLNRRVELNLEIKRLEAELTTTVEKLRIGNAQ